MAAPPLPAWFPRICVRNYAVDVPVLSGDRHQIGLCVPSGADANFLRAHGAVFDRGRWTLPRMRGIRLAPVREWLPAYAKPSVESLVGDLVPSGSWGMSLARLLTSSSWSELREERIARSGGACEMCGSSRRLELHEFWSYSDPGPGGELGVQTLNWLMVLCKDCHATQHVGFAHVQGRLPEVGSRIMRLWDISGPELDELVEALFARHEWRSQFGWKIRVEEPLASRIRWKKGWRLASDELVWDGPSRAPFSMRSE